MKNKRMVLFDILARNQFNDKTAVSHNGESLSYKGLYEKAVFMGNMLREINFSNRNIGIYIGNSINYVIAYFAATYIGGTIVPIEVGMPAAKIGSFVESIDLGLVLTDDTHYDSTLCSIKSCAITIINISSIFWQQCDSRHLMIHLPKFNYNSESVAIMIQTSGTTARPKMVMLTHQSLITNAELIIREYSICDSDTTLVVLPIRLSCNTSQFLTHLIAGASIVFESEMFDAKRVVEDIEHYQITNTSMVPPMLYLLNKHLNASTVDRCKTLRYLCYSGCQANQTIVHSLQQKLKQVDLSETYGLTEAGPRIANIHKHEKRWHPLSVGKPMESVFVKVINDQDKEVTVNDIGEIIVKSNSLMKGYYKNPAETSAIFIQGWMRTGDVGYVDENGFIYITGRKKAIINCGGNKISPEEVETVLMMFPGVSEAYVYAKKHSVLGQIVAAQIVLNDLLQDDFPKIKEQIFLHCASYLENHKLPRELSFVDQIPKNSSGKVTRKNYDKSSTY